MLQALERELKQLRFSQTQRESLDRHMNGALNAGDQANKLIRTHAERFEQHTNQTTQLVEDLEQEVMTARLLPMRASNALMISSFVLPRTAMMKGKPKVVT